MAISTNSIIHYTDSFKYLELIIKEGFAIKYCSERFIIEGGTGSIAAHPMISFCDIPLSQSFKHFDAYGKYGIGLSKDWAYEMGINPVWYIEKKSLIAKTLYEFLVDRRDAKSNLNAKQKSNILRLKCFIKNYSGHLKRKSIDDKNYRFYDEREWRLVPEKSDINGKSFSIDNSLYQKDKDKYNNKLSKVRFHFKPKDISYVIVDKTIEIPKMINILRVDYATKCTAQELDILFSKICSTEQILSDY
jgi:hypothetical protein